MKAVITQSNYLPWRGWFAMVRTVDTLIYLDDVQYTRRDWRNRNLIASQHGPTWLTVPVQVRGRYHAKINEIESADRSWWKSHQSSLDSAYRKYAAYGQIRDELAEKLAVAGQMKFLSEINHFLNDWLFSLLSIRVNCLDSRNFPASQDKTDRLVNLCAASFADTYVSGPAAQAYLDIEKFREANISVDWVQYDLLPELPLGLRFDRELSVIHSLATLGAIETIRLSTFIPPPAPRVSK